jgi:hypothetical protein
MRLILVLLCIFLSIKFIHNTQCSSRSDLVGHCGCCSLIGGNCIYYNTIDGLSMSWHLCVPDDRKKTFSLEQCKPNPVIDKNFTRLCRTTNETFRLFPQCVTKDICFLAIPARNCMRDGKFEFLLVLFLIFVVTPECNTTMAVKGSCGKSFKRFSYDSKQRECVPFIYSGCGGTTNRFMRKDRCEKICIKST